MFLRKKKVGSSYYFQLVESSRTKNGPRLKIHATLGRADHLEESGKLDRLAANFVKYSQDTLLLSRSKPAQAARLPASALQDVVIRKLLSMGKLDQPLKAFISESSTPADLREALRQALFEPGTVTSPKVLKSILDMGAHAEAVAGLIANECEADNRLFVHLDKHPGSARRNTLLSGSITATAVNSGGRVLMMTHWLEYLPFPEMLEMHLDYLRTALGKEEVVVVLGRALLNQRLVAFFVNQALPFVAPLHEPGTLLSAIPGQVFEEKPETPPFEDIRSLRYVRAVDNQVAHKEGQIREFQQTRIRGMMQANPRQARLHHDALARMAQMSRFEGTTLLATNLEEASPKDILQTYLFGQTGRRFQLLAAQYLMRLSMSPDLPRDIEPLLSGGLTLHLLANCLADRLSGMVECHAGEHVAWPQIAFVLNHEAPLVIDAEGQGELLAIPSDAKILLAVMQTLEIEPADLVKRAASLPVRRTRRREIEPIELPEDDLP